MKRYLGKTDQFLAVCFAISALVCLSYYSTATTVISDTFVNTTGTINASSIMVEDINSSDWTNVSITESQITDFRSYILSATNIPDANISSSANWNNAYTWSSANHTNWDIAFNWGDHSIAGYLISYTESDPHWTANQTNYYNKSDVDSLDTNTNTSVVNWVTGQSYLISETDPNYPGDVWVNESGDDVSWLNVTGTLNTTDIEHTGNITNPINTTWGIFNNGSCIVIGDLSYVSEC